MDKGIEALINKPIHQERRFQFIGKKQIEYWAEIDAGAYKYLPESERRIVYSELEVKALIAALGQAQRYSKKRDEENQDLMLTIGRLRVEREQLESSPNGMMQLSNELAEMKRKCSELESRQFNEVELRELLTWRYTERSASMDPLLWAAMRNKIILTIEELNTAGGTVEGVE